MRAVRDRAEARWLPSRFRFALGRFYAYLVFARAARSEQRGLILMIDRDQNTAESYLISAGVIVVSTCYAAAALGSILHPVVAALLALPLAAIAIEIPFFVSALLAALLRIRDAKPINGALSAAVLFGISAWMTFSATWVRFIAWGVFVVVAMNAIAAVFVWPLRKRIDELERSYREASP